MATKSEIAGVIRNIHEGFRAIAERQMTPEQLARYDAAVPRHLEELRNHLERKYSW